MPSAITQKYLQMTSQLTYRFATFFPSSAGCFQSATRRGAATVLRSFVQNARKVFAVLAESQLDDPKAGGISFHTLFRMCRERFLVSNEGGLKALLTEFRDHELIKTRAGADGVELLYAPMQPDALKAVLEEMESAVA